jgi:hypothetical protein
VTLSHLSVVQQIIQRSGLRREHGNPLYAYRTTVAELGALHDALRTHCATTTSLDTPTAGAFCLFGAEWFCRTYAGGPWAWRPILEATGFRGTTQALYGVVLRGLAFWHRPLIVSGPEREFLVTLGCEGGLPLGLLRGDGSAALHRFFRDLLGAREAYRRPARELVAEVAHVLPPMLRQDVVFGLAAQLVDAVADLRVTTGLAADPVGHLDLHRPEWRETVPIRLDDEVARRLLSGLLRAPRAPAVEFIEVETRLSLEGVPRFERIARFPATMRSEDLEQQLGVARGALPPRVYLHLITADGARFPVATATHAALEEAFDIAPLPYRPVRDPRAILGRVLLSGSAGSRDIACVQPPGGDELEALPWVLRGLAHAGGHTLLAIGSLRTATEEVLLALPAEGELVPEPGALVEEVCELSELDRRVVRLRGQAHWEGQGERCPFRTSVPTDADRYVLQGSLRRFGFEGAEVWLGPPRWGRLRADGSTAELGASFRQEWRPARSRRAWEPLNPDCCGDVLIRLRRDGETVTRTSVSVLPRGVQLDVRPSHDARRGRLELLGLGDGRIGIDGASGLRWEVTREGARTIISLESEGKPPPTIDLRIHLDRDREARVRAPFPSKMRHFLGGDGEVLSDRTVVSLERLSSARARAIAESGASGFVVEARLGDTWSAVGRLRRVSETCFELALDTLHEAASLLLASSADLDATVQLRIVPEKGALVPPHPELKVGRHDAHLSPE